MRGGGGRGGGGLRAVSVDPHLRRDVIKTLQKCIQNCGDALRCIAMLCNALAT